MAEDISLPEITVTAHPDWQDDDDDHYEGSYNPPSPPRTFAQVIKSDPEAAISKYKGANGAVKAIIDAAAKGTDQFIVGEIHTDMVNTFKTMENAIKQAKPGMIAGVTIELPTYFDRAFTLAGNNRITKQQFADMMAKAVDLPPTQVTAMQAALYNLIQTGKAYGVPVVPVDWRVTYASMAAVDLNDTATYNNIDKKGLFNRNGMVLSHQGALHLINAKPNTPGLDDVSASKGHTVTTAIIATQAGVNRAKAELSGAKSYNFSNDAPDLTFIGGNVSVGKTFKDAFGIDGKQIATMMFDKVLIGKSGSAHYNGGAKNDLFEDVNGGTMKINGGAGEDTVSYIRAGSGVYADLDNFAGNTGNARGDTYTSIENLYGSLYNDKLLGDGGDNELSGDAGNDELYGRAGSDELFGNFGDDLLDGGYGNDVLFGGYGNDILYGGTTGNDALYGETGNDILYGGNGDDNLSGGDGADKLLGEEGNDRIYGNQGDDNIYGGAGNDYLSGGVGKDIFFFGKADGIDHIVDFQPGIDKLFFTSGFVTHNPPATYEMPFVLGTKASDLNITQTGSDVKIVFDSTQVIIDDARIADVKSALLMALPIETIL